MGVIGDGAMTDADWFAEYKAMLNAVRIQQADRVRELERENRALWAALGYARQAAGVGHRVAGDVYNAADADTAESASAEDAMGEILGLLDKVDTLTGGVVPLAPAGGAGSGAGA